MEDLLNPMGDIGWLRSTSEVEAEVMRLKNVMRQPFQTEEGLP
jgi:hypothetical protein